MKTLFVAMTALCLFAISCDGNKADSADNDAKEKNLTAIAEINKAIASGDVSKLDQYIAADVVDHASPAGDIKGRDSVKSMLAKIHTMGTDMNMQNIRTVADGEYVFQWMRVTGTTASSDMGMPPGSKYDINAVQVTRFADGKAVEHWEFMQPADMAKMMGSEDMEPISVPDTTVGTVQNN